MADFMESFASGYKAMGDVQEDKASKDILKQAYEGAGGEAGSAGTKPVDMFKVNSIAQQMAAQQGLTRVADKFGKEAQSEKTNMYSNQLNENQAQQMKLENAERMIHSLDSPTAAYKMLIESDVPTQQKLLWADKLKQIGDDPEKFKAFKSQMEQGVLTAKERVTAQEKLLRDQWAHEDRVVNQQIKLEGIRETAKYRERDLDRKERAQDWREQLDEDKLDLNRIKAANDVDKEVDKMIAKATKGKDPEETKVIEKRYRKLASQRKAALGGRRSSGGGEGDDNKGKDSAEVPIVNGPDDYSKVKSGQQYRLSNGELRIKR